MKKSHSAAKLLVSFAVIITLLITPSKQALTTEQDGIKETITQIRHNPPSLRIE
ncbi:hypothetical protein GE022_006910 [Streptococcus canis]|nr:hypothetical protein GE022_006910 [Streptococcus canis]